MESLSNTRAGAIAMNRFGLGARADETPPDHPQAWLLGQFAAYEPLPAAWRNEPGALVLAARFGAERQQDMAGAAATNASNTAASTPADTNAQQAARRAVNQAIRRESVGIYRSAVNARLMSALQTDTPFVERLVHFWSNHFAVSVDKALIAGIAGAFEMEAIRPHVLGNFADMLVAVEQHPAMQLFLDQTRSIGPDSRAALHAEQRDPAHRRGLNENLAREIMELHTLGVRTGYTQDDVTEFARALTGWSVAGVRGPQPGNMANGVANGVANAVANAAAPGSFVFRPALHEPGARTVMGKRYDQPGEQQAFAILNDLAHASATSRHIAFQLARHFVADNPPPDLTARLALAFEQSGGDLPTVYRALVEAPQAWRSVDAKFKTPWEWTVSSMRGLGWRDPGDVGDLNAAPLLTQLGQPVWRPGSPAGYDDIAASWAAPDALVRRVEAAQRFSARVGDRLDPRTLGNTLMGATLSAPTAAAVAHAESASTAIALLLVSPDFLRR